jgi:hypothetical protein
MRMRWAVPGWMPAVEGLAAVTFAAVAVVTSDPPSVLVAALAAVILAVFAVRDALVRVRVNADADGVTVVEGFAGRRQVPWAEVATISAGGRGRFGTAATLLEIDTGDTVHLFSRRELGAAPADVAEALRALRRDAFSP